MSIVAGLTDTQERYLEAAYLQETANRVARVKNLAAALGVRAPSVTLVMKALAARGLVEYERYGAISLTERGREAGRELLLRRRATEDFLSNVLGVNPIEARDVAENIEHHIPAPVLCRLVQFVDHYKSSVGEKYRWHLECAELCGTRYGSVCPNPPLRSSAAKGPAKPRRVPRGSAGLTQS
jgi:Mn-dependent DtxR family transcriptional regulator